MSEKIKQARETIAQTFREDPSLKRTYRDNIAMVLYDKTDATDPVVRNDLANELLHLIFEK